MFSESAIHKPHFSPHLKRFLDVRFEKFVSGWPPELNLANNTLAPLRWTCKWVATWVTTQVNIGYRLGELILTGCEQLFRLKMRRKPNQKRRDGFFFVGPDTSGFWGAKAWLLGTGQSHGHSPLKFGALFADLSPNVSENSAGKLRSTGPKASKCFQTPTSCFLLGTFAATHTKRSRETK